jgi:hypothetical protein
MTWWYQSIFISVMKTSQADLYDERIYGNPPDFQYCAQI